jgi:hypothetical protein
MPFDARGEAAAKRGEPVGVEQVVELPTVAPQRVVKSADQVKSLRPAQVDQCQ